MGFGRGLLAAGRADERVVALCADLVESTQMHLFAEAFPQRYFEVGVAEQNLATVAAGMAASLLVRPGTSVTLPDDAPGALVVASLRDLLALLD